MNTAWVNYMITAAQHSKGSAGHWFRYLRKDIKKYGTLFTEEDVDELFGNEALTLFQRVSLKAAFEEGSPTQQYIISLNNPANLSMISVVRENLTRMKLESEIEQDLKDAASILKDDKS